MSSRSHRKFLSRIDKSFSFKDRVAVGQWIRKLKGKECTLDQVPENIRNMIQVNKPAEVAVEAADVVMDAVAADGTEPNVPEEHIHSEHCHHADEVVV